MALGPIISLQIDEQKMETVTDFIILGSQITVDIDCSPEIKRCLLLGRKAMRHFNCSIIKIMKQYIKLEGNTLIIRMIASRWWERLAFLDFMFNVISKFYN